MNQQILLISYVDTEISELRTKLQEGNPGCVVETAMNMRQGFQRLAHHPAQLIVMNFDILTEIVYKHVRNLKAVVDKCPLLVLGKVESGPILNHISAIPHTVVLEKPYDDKDLGGLTRKILGELEVYQRVHRRFNTSQKASIEIYGKNVESESTLINLSRGGAFLVLPNARDIVVGDLVRLNVDLNETQNNYRMHAKVVWTSGAGLSPGEYGVGVEFIHANDVYREMQGR